MIFQKESIGSTKILLTGLVFLLQLSIYFSYNFVQIQLQMPISILQPAPNFTLYNSAKELVSLSDFKKRKNILLLFFPLAFTSTCTEELCAVRDDIASYNDVDAQVLGISVDSIFTLAKYKEVQNYNFPLLSDFNKEVSFNYECIYEYFGAMKMKGVSKRAAFIIDKEGIIQYKEVLENAGEIPNFYALKEKLKSLS